MSSKAKLRERDPDARARASDRTGAAHFPDADYLLRYEDRRARRTDDPDGGALPLDPDPLVLADRRPEGIDRSRRDPAGMTRQRIDAGYFAVVDDAIDAKIAESATDSGRWSDTFEIWIGPGSNDRSVAGVVLVVETRYIGNELCRLVLLELNESGAVDLAKCLLEATTEL